jgi:hypothetical protein
VTELIHHLVGYDRITEKVVDQYDIPSEKWDAVRRIIRADDDDPSVIEVYPVDGKTARHIVEIIHERIRSDLDYFIESSKRG